MRTDLDVIVVGAGLAGLAAGATAAAGGAAAVVLDTHGPGGRARTSARDGYAVNLGAHALYRGGPGWAVLGGLGVEPLGTPPPLSRYRLLVGDRRPLMPSGAGTLLRTTALGPRAKAQLGRLLARLGRMDAAALAGRSVTGWLREQALRPDAEAVVRAVVRLATYAADLDELGADAAVGQLQASARGGVLYLHGGWRTLVEALAARVEVRPHHRVVGLEPDGAGVAVHVQVGGADPVSLRARRVVVAAGTPAAARELLVGAGSDPGWGDLGPPVTAACLDVGVSTPPAPGYLLGVDEPLYATTQGPPARVAPAGQALVSVVRYGARSPELDRPALDRHLEEAGVARGDVRWERFLARMVVAGALPRADRGGLAGRPAVTATGLPGVLVAGDWVGGEGMLSDTSLASGAAAGRLVLAALGGRRAGTPVR